MDISEVEAAAMVRALELGETVRGRTSPNPAVGAVVLGSNCQIAGEGATSPVGGPHAEVLALAAAGSRARGGTAVVTLEPCAHFGHTGPCVDALVAAGIAKVIYAIDDPNATAAGGAQILRNAGIQVLAGLDQAAAMAGALGTWVHAVRQVRPFVTWKYAASFDGRAAAADYSARWISSEASRADAHKLRSVVDAIVVGSGTVLRDDPQLTSRPVDDAQGAYTPLRVVIDRTHRVCRHARVLDSSAPSIILDTKTPTLALDVLYARGIRHVLLEGGPTLAGAFLESRCVDQVVAYLAPKLLGSGAAALGDAGVMTINEAIHLEIDSISRFDKDIKVVGRPIWHNKDRQGVV